MLRGSFSTTYLVEISCGSVVKMRRGLHLLLASNE